MTSTPVFGLENFSGRACWFNAILQALLSSPNFCHSLLANANFSPTSEMLALLLNIASADEIYSPVDIFLTLCQSSKLEQKQQDACEGLEILLQHLGSVVTHNFQCQWQVAIYCKRCQGIKEDMVDITLRVIRPRDGIAFFTESRDSVPRDSVPRDSVPRDSVPRDSGTMEDFISAQITHLIDYKCLECKRCTSGYQIAQLSRAPKILVIFLEKSKGKWTGESFKHLLQVTYGALRNHNATYRLRAIVKHFGERERGHYVTLGVRNDELWIFNDSATKKVGEIFDVQGAIKHSPEDYLIFYDKTEDSRHTRNK
jgi:hypothetical protein